jgi:hypothetical protein
MRAWREAVALATLVLGVAFASPSFAQPSVDQAVDVVIAAGDADAQAMRAVVAELIGRLRLTANVSFSTGVIAAEVITPRAGAEPRTARAWIDLTQPERVTLYLVDRDWERVLVRHVRKVTGHDELAREAIGHILETAVDALAHGATIGVAREQVGSDEPQAPPSLPSASLAPGLAPPRAAGPPHGEIGAAVESEMLASDVVATGPAADVYIGADRGRLRLGGWLTLQYRLPVVVNAAPLGVRLDGASLRALATVDAPAGKRLAFRFGIGAALDATHMTPRLEGKPDTMVAKDQDFAVLVARISAGAVARLSAHLVLTFTVSCDVDPSGTRYVALVQGTETTVLSPWPARPALSLGIAIR